MRKAQPVELGMPIPKPFTPRSLVGMTMGARKRRWAKDYDALPQSGRAAKTVSMLRAYGVYPKEGNPLAQRLRPCPGCCSCKSHMLKLRELKRAYPATAKQHPQHLRRIIERRSWRCGVMVMHDGADSSDHLHRTDVHCDGSGVLPARRP